MKKKIYIYIPVIVRFTISFFCHQNANSPYYGHALHHLSPPYSRELIFVRYRILAFPGVSSCSGILCPGCHKYQLSINHVCIYFFFFSMAT